MRRRRPVVLGLILLGASLPAAHAQTVPGFDVTPYATVIDPTLLTFDGAGNAFVGRDNSGSGGGTSDAVKIHRIGVGGAPVDEYGAAAITDPDTVLFDATGTISGVAGSVLVGGAIDATSTQGQVTAIRPDQSIVVLFGPSASFRNPNQLAFDHAGRLLFADTPTSQVFVSTGATPIALFPTTAPVRRVTADATDRIFTTGDDGHIRVHDSTGLLVNDAFATGLGASPTIAFGPGGTFGTELYVLSAANGDLIRFDALGTPTTVGTGFDASDSIAFGPDGALYVAEFQLDRILKVTPITTTTTTSSSTSTTTSTSTTSSSSTTATSTTTSTTLPPICVDGTTISHAALVIVKAGGRAGDERVVFGGRLDFELGVPHNFDPATKGAQLLIEDLASPGTTVLDLTYRATPIAPGAVGTQCGPKDGWSGTRYRNVSGRLDTPACTPNSANGLTLLRFHDRRSKDKGIQFTARTQHSTLPPVTGPLRATLVLGATATESLAGECGVLTFPADRCTLRRGTLRCR